MTEKGEASNASAPQSGKAGRRYSITFYLACYGVILVAIVGGSIAAAIEGVPKWPVIIGAVVVSAIAMWLLDKTPANPHRELDRDAFGRSGFLTMLHMLRAWKLRGQEVDWRELSTGEREAPLAKLFDESLGVVPEVIIESDGLTWLAGERDWHGWPDPPRFVVVGFDGQGKVKAADDIGAWPKRWRIPLSPVQGRYND